ncbi:MAG TPA: heme-binding protein [Verrucomicrobiae bacterium]
MTRVPANLVAALLALLTVTASAVSPPMFSNEVAKVIAQAIARAEQIEPGAAIAVVDREGYVLGVWSMNGKFATADELGNILDAITKAGTASFLSSDQHAFTSRTAGFIVQQHFPPGIRNRPNGPLVGVNFSNLSFTDVNRFKNPIIGRDTGSTEGGTNGASILDSRTVLAPLRFVFPAVSGLAGSPGGVPLFRDGMLIGGIGVAGRTRAPAGSPISGLADIQVRQEYDPDEDVALAGQKGFQPSKEILGSHVFIDGIRVAYVKSNTRSGTVRPLGTVGVSVPSYPITSSPVVSYPSEEFGGQMCEIRSPITNDIPGDINGQPRLTADEVRQILSKSSARAKITRAGIRLPRGRASQNFIAVVSNPNETNQPPVILGTIRTPGATFFSWDVAVQKARSALFFSDNTRAFSTRTIGFLAQQFYPPGIADTPPGPFYALQEKFSLVPGGIVNPLNQAVGTSALTDVPNPNLPNGVTIFPGGFPLYRHGVLIGAIGVSGDGIDQDDIIAVAGTVDFLPPASIRADYMQFRGARLPYAKFPRNPDL